MIEMKGVWKTFGKKEARVEALRGIDLSISQGEMVAIMGKSGSGKSTLLNILGGMMPMDDGAYLYQGRQIAGLGQKALARFRRDEIGFVVQYFALVDDLNIFQNVALPLKYQGHSKKEIREMVMDALGELEIAEKAKAYPCELSGGQQQRVAIARALALNPDVLFFDEPTSALDPELTRDVLQVIRDLAAERMTMVIVTHEMSFARDVADHLIFMDDGRVVEAGRAADVINNPVHERTRAFLSRYEQG